MKPTLNTLQSKRHNPAKFADLYEMGKKLGEGNFAIVYEVTSKKDQVSGLLAHRRERRRTRTASLFPFFLPRSRRASRRVGGVVHGSDGCLGTRRRSLRRS
jgi:hypothetical protein